MIMKNMKKIVLTALCLLVLLASAAQAIVPDEIRAIMKKMQAGEPFSVNEEIQYLEWMLESIDDSIITMKDSEIDDANRNAALAVLEESKKEILESLKRVQTSHGITPGSDAEPVIWSGGELELYPAYIALPSGFSVYLDWNTRAPLQEIEWQSNNSNIATVDSNGFITAVSVGETIITAALKDKPDVWANCGVYVKPFSEGDDEKNAMLLWEDAPPSLSYRIETIGEQNLCLVVEAYLGFERGENIPVSIYPDDEIATPASAANTWQSLLTQFVPTSGGSRAKVVRNYKISKQKTRRKVIDFAKWTIIVDDKRTEVWGSAENGFNTAIFTHNMRATKSGGKSPAGVWHGTAKDSKHIDYTEHYKVWRADHSGCWKCYRKCTEGTGVAKYMGDPIEWMTFEDEKFKGEYFGLDKSEALFKITKTDEQVVKKIVRPEPPKNTPGKSKEEYQSELIKHAIAMIKYHKENKPQIWYRVDAKVYWQCEYNAERRTNLGGDWSETRIENEYGELSIKIYNDNTVKVHDKYREYSGVITKSFK
jgi:hypothetical protein